MNTNIKITLTDAQRNVLKRRLTGKDTKAMISRAELNQLVQEYVNDLLAYKPISKPLREVANNAQSLLDAGATQFSPKLVENLIEGHDDCCKSVELLHARCRNLQSKLDKVGAK